MKSGSKRRRDSITSELESVGCALRTVWVPWAALAALAWSTLVPCAKAQESVTWTLASVTEAAIQRAPQVLSARASLEAARAYRTYGTMPRVGNPVLSARAMIGRPDQSAATYSGLLGLPFDVSGRRRAWRTESSWIEREAEARLLVVQNDVRAEAREAFVDVALGLEQQRVAAGNAEIAGDFLARVKARFDAKAATALDVALSQRDYAESTAAVAQAQERLVGAQGRLRQLLDLAPQAGMGIEPLPAPLLPEGLSRALAIEKALKQRREAAMYEASAERAGASDVRLRREAIAPLQVNGEYEAQANDNTRSSGGVSVMAELPVLLRNQGDRAVVRAEGQVARLNAELTRRRVAREALTSFEQLESALNELAAIEQDAMPAAEQALAMTSEMLEAGAIDFFRLLSARQSAFGLRARRVEVLRNVWRLRIALERSMGGVEEAP